MPQLMRARECLSLGKVTHMGERLALLCFPHAGGTAAFFRRWRDTLGDVAELIPLEVAGHGARRNERLPSTLAESLTSLWPSVIRHIGRRYVVFGHSLGALYAFESARALSRIGRPPDLLLVSGRNGPLHAIETPPCHDLPDADFVARLSSYGGIPAELRRDPAIMRFFLPTLRADMRIAERYVRAEAPRLNCPITVLCGDDDPLVSTAGISAWRLETGAATDIITMPGGHFCLREPAFEVHLHDALATTAARVAAPESAPRRSASGG